MNYEDILFWGKIQKNVAKDSVNTYGSLFVEGNHNYEALLALGYYILPDRNVVTESVSTSGSHYSTGSSPKTGTVTYIHPNNRISARREQICSHKIVSYTTKMQRHTHQSHVPEASEWFTMC